MKDKIIDKKPTEKDAEISNKAKYISYFMLGFILIFGVSNIINTKLLFWYFDILQHIKIFFRLQ
jgi:hypothetical protein